MISNVRVRYSGKGQSVQNIGSAVQTFQVANKGNVPCDQRPPCSQDGKWKAASGGPTLDAGPGNQFHNVRLSCIAGPCPFTQIVTEEPGENGRMLNISILNWSDTTTFLLEAEVSQTRVTDIIRQSYPAIFGSTLSFTLPAEGEGPSIEAELNGHDILFPLGPALLLSWANCSVNVSPNKNKLFRCDLKAGYRFR